MDLLSKVESLSQVPSTMIVKKVGFYPHFQKKSAGKVTGSYVYVPTVGDLLSTRILNPQFVGCHRCLCFTLRRPPHLKNLADLSIQLGRIEPFGPVAWMGSCKTYLEGHKSRMSAKFYLKKKIWDPINTPLSGRFNTTGIIHPVKAPKGGFRYWILSLPGIKKSRILPDWIEM